eukprot:CAMPEP_0183585798 /NCGR_PEP_ID=MMETSP0371-20130417/156001_1 /TAXON_ID=268820 /ORGANISM="Peridinium aciculiferum, Strain PAER-2" /LENGTH=66 /DNA_ID=CAMNT_0025796807 /DNA_START=44 /DNA_END=241 /DNA_ORIENTATION=-
MQRIANAIVVLSERQVEARPSGGRGRPEIVPKLDPDRIEVGDLGRVCRPVPLPRAVVEECAVAVGV